MKTSDNFYWWIDFTAIKRWFPDWKDQVIKKKKQLGISNTRLTYQQIRYILVGLFPWFFYTETGRAVKDLNPDS